MLWNVRPSVHCVAVCECVLLIAWSSNRRSRRFGVFMYSFDLTHEFLSMSSYALGLSGVCNMLRMGAVLVNAHV